MVDCAVCGGCWPGWKCGCEEVAHGRAGGAEETGGAVGWPMSGGGCDMTGGAPIGGAPLDGGARLFGGG